MFYAIVLIPIMSRRSNATMLATANCIAGPLRLQIASPVAGARMEMNSLSVVSTLHEQNRTFDEEQGTKGEQVATDYLIHHCVKNKNLLLFLRATGNYWTEGGPVVS